jgi:VIT1/CCC1 family predicted Fe2+/Mn2+ transporter
MPQHPHVERHFTGSRAIRDIVIGMSDGLTVPFALAAGLSGVDASSSIVITAGLAEIAAGSIAMGLGGYLAAKGDAEHYESERRREEREIREDPEEEAIEVQEILGSFGVPARAVRPLLAALRKNPRGWLEVLMRLELGLEKPAPQRALGSALTIAGSYVVGGAIPLAPYLFVRPSSSALVFSAVATLASLLIFGAVKGRLAGTPPLRGGLQTLLVGGLAAAAAFLIARAIS